MDGLSYTCMPVPWLRFQFVQQLQTQHVVYKSTMLTGILIGPRAPIYIKDASNGMPISTETSRDTGNTIISLHKPIMRENHFSP